MAEILFRQGGTYVYVGPPNERLGTPTVMWTPDSGATTSTIILYSMAPPKPGQEKRC